MPEVARFYGIIIQFFFDDHAPPHFHALYAEHEALFEIDTLSILRGSLPKRAKELVMLWATEHKEELNKEWELARNQQPLFKIEPLD